MNVFVGPYWEKQLVGTWKDGELEIDGDCYAAEFRQILTVARSVTELDVWMHPV